MSRVSLAELKAAGIKIRADEAATIVREICRLYSRRAIAGIPGPDAVQLSKDGKLSVKGELRTDAGPIPAAAALLESLPAEMPGAMRLVLARATGALDVPPFSSIDEFSAALERFGTVDLRETGTGLYRAWATLQPDEPRRSGMAAKYGWVAAAAALVLILVGLFVIPSHSTTSSRHLAADYTPPPIAPAADHPVAAAKSATSRCLWRPPVFRK